MKKLPSLGYLGMLLGLGSLTGLPEAALAQRQIPSGAEQFMCYEFGLSNNNTWTFPDQCFSFSLNLDPFANGLLAGKKAIVTDLIFTPTTSANGTYYFGVAQSTTGGNNSNPQVYLRTATPDTFVTNSMAPMLVISAGNTMRFFNSSTSPGTSRFIATGYIVDDVTVNADCTAAAMSIDGETFVDERTRSSESYITVTDTDLLLEADLTLRAPVVSLVSDVYVALGASLTIEGGATNCQ